jgi:hypothetical protein
MQWELPREECADVRQALQFDGTVFTMGGGF